MITFVIVSFGDAYKRYKDALIMSIESNMQNAKIKDIQLDYIAPDMQKANHVKLKAWYDAIEGNTILIDADTIVLGDVSEVFDMKADLIYTKRFNNPKIPFNSGVVFVKESAKFLIKKWMDIDEQMNIDSEFHATWKKKAYGFNQASFACLLNNSPTKSIKYVPSYIYNSCDPIDWKENHAQAKIVHVKGLLRQSVNYRLNRYKLIEEKIKKYYLTP